MSQLNSSVPYLGLGAGLWQPVGRSCQPAPRASVSVPASSQVHLSVCFISISISIYRYRYLSIDVVCRDIDTVPTVSSKACLFLFSAYLQINNKTNVVTSPKENIPTPALVYLEFSFSCYLEVFDCLVCSSVFFLSFSLFHAFTLVCFLKTGFGKPFFFLIMLVFFVRKSFRACLLAQNVKWKLDAVES